MVVTPDVFWDGRLMPVGTPRLKLMGPGDVPEVMAVERASYSAGWPATAFERELTQNAMARYLVLRSSPPGPVVGFGGLWLMVDEAHIVTVAIVPSERRRGLGSIVVHGLMSLAIEQQMALATLEVRVSNEAARALYAMYGFYEVGLRKRYYADNHEDAVIMTTEDIQSEAYGRRLRALGDQLRERFRGLSLELTSPGLPNER
jgi:ribosomal-protein-alanine N-acetyltransferase